VGGSADTLVNYGDAYESYYFTTADVASAQWVIAHDTRGQVVYTDAYGQILLYRYGHPNGLVTTVIPQLIEPGAFVYATSTNIVDRTARSNADNENATYQFPQKFLDSVKNIVFTTGTTEVFR